MDSQPPAIPVVDEGFAPPPPTPSGGGNSTTVVTPGKKKGRGKIIATILGLLLLVGGVGAGVTLVQQQQELRERASGSCTAEQVQCSGECVDLLTDGNNCGTCGNTCVGSSCINGACQQAQNVVCNTTGNAAFSTCPDSVVQTAQQSCYDSAVAAGCYTPQQSGNCTTFWVKYYCQNQFGMSGGCQQNGSPPSTTRPSFDASFCGTQQIDCANSSPLIFESREDTSACTGSPSPGGTVCTGPCVPPAENCGVYGFPAGNGGSCSGGLMCCGNPPPPPTGGECSFAINPIIACVGQTVNVVYSFANAQGIVNIVTRTASGGGYFTPSVTQIDCAPPPIGCNPPTAVVGFTFTATTPGIFINGAHIRHDVLNVGYCENTATIIVNDCTDTTQCLDIKAYDTNWVELNTSQIQPGQVVRFAVRGSAASGRFNQARFYVNGVRRAAVSTTNPADDQQFYEDITIPAGTTFQIGGQVHHIERDLWF